MRKITLITISLLLLTASALAADNIVHGGAIARSPALVVASRSNGSWWAAQNAKDALKKQGYKIYHNRILTIDFDNQTMLSDGIRCSSAFYYSGHMSADHQFLGEDVCFIDKSHIPSLLRNNEQYGLVFLDGCESFFDSSWADAFSVEGRGEIFLGWHKTLPFGAKNIWGAWPSRLRQHDNVLWTVRFWDSMGEGKMVRDAIETAGSIWSTKNVISCYKLDYEGDLSVKLK